MPEATPAMDFFVSHADADVEWAEWIGTELEAAGYGVIVKAWDFRPGDNLVAKTDEALANCRHTVAVLSSNYVTTELATRTAAQYRGVTGKDRALIPIRVTDCDIPPSLGPMITIDLYDVDSAEEARRRLRSGVAERAELVGHGKFPGGQLKQARFPLAGTEVWELRGHRPDPNFTGRDELLATMHRAFRAGHPTSAIQALTGLWGLGKTRLAVEYANRHAAAYDVVWWVRAENPAILRGDYAELARALNLPFDQDDQALAALRQELRRRKNWLLIFDNAEDPDELLPLLPDRHTGHVLITSQRREWPAAETRQLGVLPAEVAAGFLTGRGQVADPGLALELAEALGGLPLALAQAASVIADGFEATEYLALLRDQSPELFEEGRPADYRKTVVSTWRVSFGRLGERSPAAVALFRLCAFLGAESIPLARLKPVPEMAAELVEVFTNPFSRRRATGALAEYSLAEAGDGLLSIHRLVQAVTRAELGADEAHWAGLAVHTIAAAFPQDVDSPSSWAVGEALLGHAVASAEHASRLAVEPETTCVLLNRVAVYLLERGRPQRAAATLDQAFQSAAKLGADSPVYYDCRNTQGLILLAQGDYPTALATQDEVYHARCRLLGPDHVETLRAGCDFVEMLYLQGQWPRAGALQDELVARFTATLGPDSLETIKALAYQATLIYAGGELARARDLEEQVLAARRRLLGDEHPDTLTSMGTLAATWRYLGAMVRARDLEEQVLAVRRRLLGDEHPATLGAMGALAATLWHQGELIPARKLEEQVLAVRRRLLGEEHPGTLAAAESLAKTMLAQGESTDARALQEQVLEIGRRVFGAEHPRTLDITSGLADSLRALDDLDAARRLDEQVLETRQRLFGEEHTETLDAMGNLAETLRAQDDLAAARALRERALEIRQRLFGDDHPGTLDCMSGLAEVLVAQGELDAALTMAARVLETYRHLFGDESPTTISAMASLASVLLEGDAKDQARALLSEAMSTSLRLLGKKNTITTEMAWRLVMNYDAPHESHRRRVLLMELSWLAKESPDGLTAQQKQILKELRRFAFGGASSSGGRRNRRRSKS